MYLKPKTVSGRMSGMEVLCTTRFETPFGSLRVVSSEKGLVYIELPNENGRGFEGWRCRHAPEAKVKAGFEPNRRSVAAILEFLAGKRQFILPGVWSARMYLKQANDDAQSLLTGVVEPLAAYTHFLGTRPYPGPLIDSAWRSLLQNHPHDSICGCSVDAVHRAMMTRFDGVLHTGDQLVRDHLRALAPGVAPEPEGDAGSILVVFNPLPFRRTEVLERLVVLRDSSEPREGWELIDGDGHTVPFALVRYHRVARFWGTDFPTEWQGDR
ncbi:MAG: hypothetical protein IH795_04290, partial [Bacteroidetes bacterium]|nr:hypothetical protein [Bacteroidota bacterium]